MMKRIVLLILISLSQLYAQVNLERITPYFNPSKVAYGINFITEDYGFIYGEKGMAYSTEDGGITWNDISISISNNIKQIEAVNNKIMFAIGGNNNISKAYKTTNGGLRWFEYSFPFNYKVGKISFLNEEIGFAVGEFASFFKTTDGGKNWNLLKSDSSSNKFYHEFDFVDENNIWIVGNEKLRTTDGGFTWKEMPFEFLYVSFTNKNIGFATLGIGFYKTTNGGDSWLHNNIAFNPSYSFKAFNENEIIALFQEQNNYYDGKKIVKVINGGQAFITLYNFETFRIQAYSFLTPNKGYVLSYPNILLKTTNGKDFYNLNGYRFSSVCALNENTVLLSERNFLLKSYDDGKTWKKILTPTQDEIKKTFFIDSLSGFFTTENYHNSRFNTVYRTSDGGYSWKKIDTNFISIEKFQFANNNIGWIESNYYSNSDKVAALYKTTNGGISWDIVNYQEGKYRDHYFFLNELIGWYKTNPGGFFKTTDGGINWTKISNSLLNNFKFFSETDGIAMGRNLYKTTNGGADWINFGEINCCSDEFSNFIIEPNLLFSIHYEYNTGSFPIPYSSHLMWSVNGEIPFQSTSFKTTGNESVSFFNEKGWFLTGRELYKISMDHTSSFEIKTSIPKEFALFQNYPNPFNPVSRIKYQVSANSFVTLKVFDILGNEITTLINEAKEPGEYEVEFNGSKYSSGVYFYTLTAGDFTATKKFVLMK